MTGPTAPISVECRQTAAGYTCRVTVGTDLGATQHDVKLTTADLADLGPGTSEPVTLVRESFQFLLEREKRESILRRFDLSVIASYFPEYRDEIRRRIMGPG